jgi:hypothetical protein
MQSGLMFKCYFYPMKAIIFIIAVLGISFGAFSQKPNAKPKPVKLTTNFGIAKDTTYVSPAQAEAMSAASLKITDNLNQEYKIVQYNLAFRRIVTAETEDSKPYLTKETKGGKFTTPTLPAMWQNAIKESVRPGVELVFYDIIVSNGKGNRMAPNVVVIVK